MRASLVFVVVLLLTGPARSEELIADFSGTGNKLTEEFEVDGPWLLDWFVTSDYPSAAGIEINLVDAVYLNHKGAVMKARNPTSGTKLFYDTGRYRFRVIATIANWRLRVSRITKEEAEAMVPVRP